MEAFHKNWMEDCQISSHETLCYQCIYYLYEWIIKIYMVAEHHFLFRNSVYVWLSPVYVWLFQWNREIFSRSSTILHIYNLWWDYFLSPHILRSKEINKAVSQMFYNLISKNTCHRSNHRCLGFTIKWYVMSNNFQAL